MAEDENEREPVKPPSEDILRKMALAGKSLPSVKPTPSPGSEDEATMKGPFGMSVGASNLRLLRQNESQRGRVAE